MKTIPAKLPAERHFQDRKLGLFQNFIYNKEEERCKLSNTIELWDSIPRYSISQKAMAKMRDERGHLDLLKLDFEFRTIKYSVQIQAALVEEMVDGPSGLELKTTAYYPSANEELVEEALRKLAVDRAGFYEKEKAQSGVVFSLYQLREELKLRGHARSFAQIQLSLSILAGSTIQIFTGGGKSKAHVKSAYLPLVAGVTREDIESDSSGKWLVQFHPLVTDSIDRLSYRQCNYHQIMSHTTQLTRWLHKLLITKYIFASKLKPFEIRYSTIKRDSAMLGNHSRSRGAQEACDLSIDELKTQGVLSSVDRRAEAGLRGKVLDVVYILVPSNNFIAEVKAASKRAKSYPQMP